MYHRYVLLILICSGFMFQNGARNTIYHYCHPLHGRILNQTDGNKEAQGQQCSRWSEHEKLYITFAFEAGSMLVQIPTGIYCDLYGAKHFFGIAILSTGFFSFLFPLVLPSTPFVVNMPLQFFQGLLGGMATPGAWNLLARWTPRHQVAFLSSLHCSFFELGEVLAGCTTVLFVMDSPHHSAPFFIWGTLIAIWYVIFLNVVYSSMMDHPYISDKERDAVIREVGTVKPQRIPWKKIMSDSATWATIAANAGDVALFITISSTSHDYIRAVMNTDTDDYAIYDLLRIVPLLICLLSISYIADYLIQQNVIETVYLRSIYVCIGGMLTCILLLAAAYSRSHPWTAITLFWIASILTAFVMASVGVNVLDRTRNYCGFFTGVTVTVQCCASFIRVLIAIIRKSPERWANIVWFDLAVNFFTTVVFLKFCKGDRAKWDVAETVEDIREEKIRTDEVRKFYLARKLEEKRAVEADKNATVPCKLKLSGI